MSYGINLTNEFGDRLLESTGLLFPHTTGTTVYSLRSRSSGGSYFADLLDYTEREGKVFAVNGSRVDATWNIFPSPTYTISNLTDGGSFNTFSFEDGNIVQVVTNNFTESYQPRENDVNNYNLIRHAVPNTSDTNYTYEAFFKLPSVGGLHTFSQYTTLITSCSIATVKGCICTSRKLRLMVLVLVWIILLQPLSHLP